MRNSNYKDAAKRRQEWAEAARPPRTPECGHANLNVRNGVVECLECGAKRLEEEAR